MDDNREDVTELHLEVDSSGLAPASPADDEPTTLEVEAPPDPDIVVHLDEDVTTSPGVPGRLQADIARARALADPELVKPALRPLRDAPRPVLTPSTAFPIGDASEVRALMAASLASKEGELPTAPAPFAVIKLLAESEAQAEEDALESAQATLDRVTKAHGPKGTLKMAVSPESMPPASAPTSQGGTETTQATTRARETPIAPKRRSRTGLVVLVLALVIGVVVAILVSGKLPR